MAKIKLIMLSGYQNFIRAWSYKWQYWKGTSYSYFWRGSPLDSTKDRKTNSTYLGSQYSLVRTFLTSSLGTWLFKPALSVILVGFIQLSGWFLVENQSFINCFERKKTWTLWFLIVVILEYLGMERLVRREEDKWISGDMDNI